MCTMQGDYRRKTASVEPAQPTQTGDIMSQYSINSVNNQLIYTYDTQECLKFEKEGSWKSMLYKEIYVSFINKRISGNLQEKLQY